MRARVSGRRFLDDISDSSIALSVLTSDDTVVMLPSIPESDSGAGGAAVIPVNSIRTQIKGRVIEPIDPDYDDARTVLSVGPTAARR